MTEVKFAVRGSKIFGATDLLQKYWWNIPVWFPAYTCPRIPLTTEISCWDQAQTLCKQERTTQKNRVISLLYAISCIKWSTPGPGSRWTFNKSSQAEMKQQKGSGVPAVGSQSNISFSSFCQLTFSNSKDLWYLSDLIQAQLSAHHVMQPKRKTSFEVLRNCLGLLLPFLMAVSCTSKPYRKLVNYINYTRLACFSVCRTLWSWMIRLHCWEFDIAQF